MGAGDLSDHELKATGGLVAVLCERLNGSAGRKYIIYSDSYFTGQDLVVSLREKGWGFCGTCKLSRFRANLSSEAHAALDRGESFSILNEGLGIVISVWKDRAGVNIASTVYDAVADKVVRRKGKAGGDGKREARVLLLPRSSLSVLRPHI